MRSDTQKNAIAQTMAVTIDLARRKRLPLSEADLIVRHLSKLWLAIQRQHELLADIAAPADYAPVGTEEIMAHFRDWQAKRSAEFRNGR